MRAQVWDLQTQLTAAKEREWRKGKELRGDIAEAEERVFKSDRALQDVAAQLSRCVVGWLGRALLPPCRALAQP